MAVSGGGTDPFQRFLDAQSFVYDRVLAELRAGQKTSHWMWFIFPQIEGLGFSERSRRYAISGLAEARAYAHHPLLGARLLECTALVNGHARKTASEIFGYPDDLKFQSSMTLFEAAVPDERAFVLALDNFYQGRRDQATLDLLGSRP